MQQQLEEERLERLRWELYIDSDIHIGLFTIIMHKTGPFTNSGVSKFAKFFHNLIAGKYL